VQRDQIAALFRCPISGRSLRWSGSSLLTSDDGIHSYKYEDGIFHLIAPVDAEEETRLRSEKQATQVYYDTFGWQRDGRGYGEVQAFTDMRSAPWSYTSKCIRRVGRFIPSSGRFLLDAASGPIPYQDYLRFSSGYERRICLDLSIEALREARRKLGDRGIYVLGDLTRLPLADDAVDAAVSFHTIYHIPEDEQHKAFTELHRVLRGGGTAAVVYSWGYSPITSRLLRLLDRLGRPPAQGTPASGLYFHPKEKEWFFEREWPFEHRVRAWRTLASSALQRLGDGVFHRFAYLALYYLEDVFPAFLGRHGQYPLILIEKRSRAAHG
jgi:SAM-dependent methyltransferase